MVAWKRVNKAEKNDWKLVTLYYIYYPLFITEYEIISSTGIFENKLDPSIAYIKIIKNISPNMWDIPGKMKK